jgi:hypothetical protein
MVRNAFTSFCHLPLHGGSKTVDLFHLPALSAKSMSDLFETQNEVTQDDCDKYARNLVKGSVTPMPWQGFHSYTLQSNSGLIIQFRSNASPLDSSTTKLAKKVHGHLAPATTYHGLMPNSSVSVWVMEIIAGVGYLFTASTITTAKLDITVTDFAK